ncbi:hypothetical protein [Acidovorax sp. KKS102]|nr:hypothetical protein [Acidovorax sp. KKS102]
MNTNSLGRLCGGHMRCRSGDLRRGKVYARTVELCFGYAQDDVKELL